MADSAAAVAQHPDAPAAERYDAGAALHNAALSELVPAPQVREAVDYILGQHQEAELAKAQRGGLIAVPGKRDRGAPEAQSVFLDDWQVASQGEYWDRPGALGFDGMRAMVDQTPILNAIVLTRQRQVARFCRPQAKRSDAGFVIQHVDKNKELSDRANKQVQMLESFMLNCGWETDPRARKRMKRDTLAGFMAKSVRDSLTMDAAPIETVFRTDRSLGLDGFHAVDGATIRLCTEHGYEGDDEVFAVQVIQGRIRAAYSYDELVYEVRNPRTDITASGYGYSETEMLIRVVTYLLNTMTYNGSFFDKNAIPRGILQLYGEYGPDDQAAFKRYWMAMQRGVQNAHNMPVLFSKDKESGADFTEIGGQLNEMAFGKWMSFLTSVACAIFGIAPEEVSMESYATAKSALSGSDTEEKLVSSSDKGLRPLLAYYEGVFSDFLIQTFSPEYCLRFVGLDADDAKNRFEMRKLVCTVNEARAQEGYDAIDGPIGDAPLNPSLLPVWQAVSGVGQPEQPEEDFGDPDAADAAAAGEDAPKDDDEAAYGKPPADKEPSQAPQPPKGGGDPEALKKALEGIGFGPVYRPEG